MKIKRCLIIVVCFVLLLGLSACSQDPEHIDVDAKCISFASLEEMENYCDTIIKGVRLNDEESVIKKSDGQVVSTYTLSQFQISEVYKDASGELKAGDIITVLENEAYDKEDNIIYHVAGYNMMVSDEPYLLFVREHTMSDGLRYYVSAGINAGTVSLSNDGRTTSYSTRTGSVISVLDQYTNLWQEAIAKYVK